MTVQNALPLIGNSTVGLRTQYATLLPPGSKVAAYVGSTQSDSLDAYSASTLLVSTLNAGLARCRPGKGDVVVVLPGHAETITTADAMNNLVAGTQIIGVAPFGSGLMPTITFGNTAATFLLDQPNCVMTGLKFAVGVDGVVSYVTVTGSGNYIAGNYFQMGTSSALDMGTALTVATGATDCIIEGNKFISLSTSVNAAAILVSGTAVDSLVINQNYVFASCATNGLVRLTGTSTGFTISGNVLHNTSGTAPLATAFANTALTGSVLNNIGFATTAVTGGAGFNAASNTTGDIRFANNIGASADGAGSLQSPAAGTGF